jgi:hypothetical protein
MTRLTRDVRRETAARVQGRELMVELGKFSLTVRQKGKRSSYVVPLEAIFMLGARIARREADALKPKRKGGGALVKKRARV